VEPELKPGDEEDALIGNTGFVGSNLQRGRSFGSVFNSSNIGEIRGRRFRTLICAAPGAEKWKASLDPQADLAAVDRLWAKLESVEAEKLVLISTVDVYPDPVGVDEDTAIDLERCAPYGRHRLELERRVSERFDSLVVRLPGLFGPGLKKNALYDLLHDHRVDMIDSRAVYQYYDAICLAKDLVTAQQARLSLVNFATEPIAIEMVAREVFGKELTPRVGSQPANYDFRSRHAALFGGKKGYLQTAAEVLDAMRLWVSRERESAQ
jgi:hypothetical protein